MWFLVVLPLAFILQWAISMETNVHRTTTTGERRALRVIQFILVLIVLALVAIL